MKRFFLFCIVQIFMITNLLSPLTVQAQNGSSIVSEDFSASDVANIWTALRESEKLLVNSEGLLYVTNNEYIGNPAYEYFLYVLEQCNLSISEGIIVATESVQLEFAEDIVANSEMLNAMRANLNSPSANYIIGDLNTAKTTPFIYVPPSIDDEGGHYCSRQYIDLMAICESNYQFLVSHYNSILIAQITNPALNAWVSTASLWLNRVRENGAWDYKVSDTYGPYNNPLCAYYDYEHHHFTAEYFGNFNYGYTGAFLFSLDTLHFGSSAVSGFDPADTSDWPAIDAGFYAKTG